MKKMNLMRFDRYLIAGWAGILALCFLAACSFEVFQDDDAGQSGSLTRFVIHNGYMYTLNPSEVVTFLIQPDGKPVEKHRLRLDYGLETILIYEGVMYLGSRNGLYIIDIANPELPVLLSATTRPAQLFGGCDPVAVKDSIVYSTVKIVTNICGVSNSTSALLVYLADDLTDPELLGTYDMSLPNGLGYKEDVLFVCDAGIDNVVLYDISNPADLKEMQWTINVNNPVDLIVHQDRLIVSTENSFHFYDIQDISDIHHLGTFSK